MKIAIVNERYSDNLGDQAIADSMAMIMEEHATFVESLDFSFRERSKAKPLIGSVNVMRPKLYYSIISRFKNLVLKYFWIFKKFPSAFAAASKKYDLAFIGGGQLVLSNSTFAASMLLWTLVFKMRGTKVILVGVGVGREFSFVERVFYRISFNFISAIYVRDCESIEILKKDFGVEAKWIPDCAYYLESVGKTQRENMVVVLPTDYSVYKRYVHEMNSRVMSYCEYSNFWISQIEGQINLGYFVVIASTTQRDLFFSRELIRSTTLLNRNCIELRDCSTWQDLVDIFSRSEKVFSGRMHALILAQIAGADIYPFIISSKINVFKDEYLGREVIDLRNEFRNTIADFFKSFEIYSNSMK